MATTPDRQAVVDALLGCVTQQEAKAALRLAGRWLREHPDDLDLRGVTESAVMVLTAWDLDLEDWPQEDRDALLRTTGRLPTGPTGPWCVSGDDPPALDRLPRAIRSGRGPWSCPDCGFILARTTSTPRAWIAEGADGTWRDPTPTRERRWVRLVAGFGPQEVGIHRLSRRATQRLDQGRQPTVRERQYVVEPVAVWCRCSRLLVVDPGPLGVRKRAARPSASEP